MTKTFTQLEAARANVVTKEMQRVAERECVTPELDPRRGRARPARDPGQPPPPRRQRRWRPDVDRGRDERHGRRSSGRRTRRRPTG